MKKQQVLLEFKSGEYLIAWVDLSFKPKAGMFFTGKDGREGKIVHVYSTSVNLEDINRGWHNNI